MRIVWLLILVIAGLLTGALVTRFEGDPPAVQMRTQVAYIGKEHTHDLRVSDQGMGVERVRIWISSGDVELELHDEIYPGNLWMGADLALTRNIEVTIKP